MTTGSFRMSPPAARRAASPGARAGAREARRRAIERRRRLTLLTGAAVASVVAIALLLPSLHHAVRDLTLPLNHADVIRHEAAVEHLDPALIAGVIYTESRFHDQTSAAGAEGLMQILPATAQAIAQRSGGVRFSVADLATPSVNIAYGAYYLRLLVNHYAGDVNLALAAYNAGQANVDRWLAQAPGHTLALADIPFAETRAYVTRVRDAQRAYRDSYGAQLGE